MSQHTMKLQEQVSVPTGHRLVGYLSSGAPVTCTREEGKIRYRVFATKRGRWMKASEVPARMRERVAKWQNIPSVETREPARENRKMLESVKAQFDRTDIRRWRHTHGKCGCGHHVGASCWAVKNGYETAETYDSATD